MELKKRGRKPLPPAQKKKAITVFVKAKFYNEAKKEIKQIEKKYL